jgi:hypothetical protein
MPEEERWPRLRTRARTHGVSSLHPPRMDGPNGGPTLTNHGETGTRRPPAWQRGRVYDRSSLRIARLSRKKRRQSRTDMSFHAWDSFSLGRFRALTARSETLVAGLSGGVWQGLPQACPGSGPGTAQADPRSNNQPARSQKRLCVGIEEGCRAPARDHRLSDGPVTFTTGIRQRRADRTRRTTDGKLNSRLKTQNSKLKKDKQSSAGSAARRPSVPPFLSFAF